MASKLPLVLTPRSNVFALRTDGKNTHHIVVTNLQYFEHEHIFFKNEVLVTGFKFHDQDGDQHTVHYHPSRLKNLGEAGLELVRAVMAGSLMFKGFKAFKNSGQRIDPGLGMRLGHMVANKSYRIDQNLIDAYSYYDDAVRFAEEGYYIDDLHGQLLIAGRITPDDLRQV